MFGHPAGPNAERGIFRTKDGGKTWEKMLYRDDKTGGIEVNFDPNNPQVLYASLWEAFRVSHMMSSGGPGSGLFKSTDGGDHWTEISRNPGLPKGVLGKIGVAVSPRRLEPRVRADRGGRRRHVRVRRCRRDVEEGEREPRRAAARVLLHARLSPTRRTRTRSTSRTSDFMKSTDGGKTWTTIRPPHGDNHDMWIDPTNPKRFIASNDGGATVTVNGGGRGRPRITRRRSSTT